MKMKEKFMFDAKMQTEIKERFYFVNEDHLGRQRQFFENSGGSLRLKSAVAEKSKFESLPDCPERVHDTALMLKEVKAKGVKDIMEIIFGAKGGSLVTELTASQVMFQITRTIIENVPGTNVVTTSIEHPSAFDSAQIYAERTGKALRVAMANHTTGGVDLQEILSHIDEDTSLLSVMSASNISGYIFDLEELVTEARKIKPDLYIISDAVQHIPHGAVDVDKLMLDGMNFAPYKTFGIRGCGYGYVSDRVSTLFHNKLTAKPVDEWELGTFPHPNFASITAVVDYVTWIGQQFTSSQDRREQYLEGMHRIHLHEHSLLTHMMEGTEEIPGLRHIPGIKVYLDSEDDLDRDLISAIGIDGMDLTEAVAEYFKRGVTVFERVNTSLYSKRIVESLGLEGAIRVSPLHCHDTEDIDEFLRITAEISKMISNKI